MRRRRPPKNSAERVLSVLYAMVNGAIDLQFSKEDIAFESWRMFPSCFGMRGYPYPNTSVLYAELSKLERMGLVTRGETSHYYLTKKGRWRGGGLQAVELTTTSPTYSTTAETVAEVIVLPASPPVVDQPTSVVVKRQSVAKAVQDHPDLLSLWLRVRAKTKEERDANKRVRRGSPTERRSVRGSVGRTAGANDSHQ